MKLNIGTMNKTWKTAGLIALAVGALAYPAYRLYKYAAQKRKDGNPEEGETLTTKLFNAYRGKHKPHHRKAEGNHHVMHNGLSQA